MRKLVIVKTGTALASLLARGDYEDWIAAGLDVPNIEVCRLEEGDALPDPDAIRGLVITGSAAMVTERLEWSERAAAWLPEVVQRGVPVLGICYGHQLLAHAFGGEVGFNPRGREVGTIEVALTAAAADDPLFRDLGPRLVVSASHQQSVLRLPEGARLLAQNEHDPHQAMAIGPRAWGLQFHPEWDDEIARAYVEHQRDALRDEGKDPDALLAKSRPSTDGAAILRRFAALTSG